jgi:hypothetical protein
LLIEKGDMPIFPCFILNMSRSAKRNRDKPLASQGRLD